jgi:hypothetical protein
LKQPYDADNMHVASSDVTKDRRTEISQQQPRGKAEFTPCYTGASFETHEAPMNTTIKSLTDKELLAKLETLSARETEATVDVLLHLAEVDARKLFVPLGHSSLFAYCRSVLKYSEPATKRRISSARCCVSS